MNGPETCPVGCGSSSLKTIWLRSTENLISVLPTPPQAKRIDHRATLIPGCAQDKAEAVAGTSVGDFCAVSLRAPTVCWATAPATTSGNPEHARSDPQGITSAGQFVCVTVPTPLIHISVHVQQPPTVRLLQPHFVRVSLTDIPGVQIVPCIAANFARLRSKRICGLCPRPATVLPFRLRRQAVRPILFGTLFAPYR